MRIREIMDELNATGLTGDQHTLITELVATCLMAMQPKTGTQRSRECRARQRSNDAVAADGVLLDNNPSIKTEKKKENTPLATDAVSLLTEVVDFPRAVALVEHRKKVRRPLTRHTAHLLANQLRKFPDPKLAADELMLRGWTSIKPEWLANGYHGPGNKNVIPLPKVGERVRTWAEQRAERENNGQEA